MDNNLCRNKLKTMTVTALATAMAVYILAVSDKVVIGLMVGEVAVGSVGLISPLTTMMLGVAVAFGGAVLECVFNETNIFNREKAQSYYNSGLWFAVLIGMLFVFIAVMSKGVLLHGIAPESPTYFYAESYLSTYVFVLLLYPVYTVLQMITYAEGNERVFITAYGSLFTVNLVFNVILCKIIGIEGCPLATIIGLSCGTLILICGRKKSDRSTVSFHRSYGMKFSDMVTLVKCAPGDIGVVVFASIFILFLNRFVTVFIGENVLPVIAVVNTIIGFVMVDKCIGNAMAPMLFQYISESNNKRVRRVIMASHKTALYVSLILVCVILMASEPMVMLLGIRSTELFQLAVWGVRVSVFVGLFYAQTALMYSFHGTVGSESLEVLLAFVTELIVPMVTIFPIALHAGIKGVFVGMIVSAIVSFIVDGIICYVYFKSKYGDVSRMEHNRNAKRDLLNLAPVFKAEVECFDLVLEPEDIIRTQSEVEKVLIEHGVSNATIMKVSLLIEEVFMLVRERYLATSPRKGVTLLGECTVIFDDKLVLVLKDNGKIFDITDTDLNVSSLRSYTVSSLMQWNEEHSNMVMLCCNRNAFVFDYE